jgi:hypothetical protein
MRWTYVAGMIPMTALAVAAVAGCSSNGSNGPSTTASATATGTASSASSVATPTSSPASTGSGGNSPAAASGTPSCATSDLKVKLGGSEGAAGSIYVTLDFTNVSSSPCTLYGYPGASLASSSGTEISPGASRSTTTAASLVTLDAGSTAHAVMQIADAGNYDASSCDPKPTTEIKLFPPDQTAALYVSYATSACVKQESQLSISTLQSGS